MFLNWLYNQIIPLMDLYLQVVTFNIRIEEYI